MARETLARPFPRYVRFIDIWLKKVLDNHISRSSCGFAGSPGDRHSDLLIGRILGESSEIEGIADFVSNHITWEWQMTSNAQGITVTYAHSRRVTGDAIHIGDESWNPCRLSLPIPDGVDYQNYPLQICQISSAKVAAPGEYWTPPLSRVNNVHFGSEM